MSTVPVTPSPVQAMESAGPSMSVPQFAARIKAAYPAYKDIPDQELTDKVIARHPVYKQSVYQGTQGGVTPTPSKAGKVFDKVAQGFVNSEPGILSATGAAVGTAIAGPVGAAVGGGLGGAAGEAAKSKALDEKPSAEKEVKSAAIGALAGPFEEAGAAIPLASRAGKMLASVEKSAGGVPVNLSRSGDEILRVKTLADSGGSMPMSINKLLNRVTNPNKGPLTYSEARDFYSNITRLSADEMGRLTPVMRRQVGMVADALKQDIGDAAAKVNKAADYYAGMKQYKQAAQLQRAGEKIAKYLAGIAGVGAGGELVYHLATKK